MLRKKQRTLESEKQNLQSKKLEETLLSLTTQLSNKINNPPLVSKSRIENIKDVDDKFADFIAELQNMP